MSDSIFKLVGSCSEMRFPLSTFRSLLPVNKLSSFCESIVTCAFARSWAMAKSLALRSSSSIRIDCARVIPLIRSSLSLLNLSTSDSGETSPFRAVLGSKAF